MHKCNSKQLHPLAGTMQLAADAQEDASGQQLILLEYAGDVAGALCKLLLTLVATIEVAED